ncbi:MAG: alpha/beta hydrolase [Thermoleophilia bacterium]
MARQTEAGKEMIVRMLKVSGSVLLGLLAVILLLALVPVGAGDMQSAASPSAGFEDSVQRIDDVLAAEAGQVCGECGSRFYSHGEKTARAVVLIHGLSNSPRQFQEMGEALYASGYNVYIPLMPYHGLNAHDVSELGNITTGELVGYADESVDIAVGLGDEVVVAGLSGGGSVAAWIAQNRADVSKVVLIAPLIGIKQLPSYGNYLFINLFSRLPQMDFASPSEPVREHVYRGQSSRGVAEYLRLAKGVRRQAGDTTVAVKDIAIIINASDDQVNNSMINRLGEEWQGSGATVSTHEFPAALGLPHDIIDVTNVKDKRDISYPVVIAAIES